MNDLLFAGVRLSMGSDARLKPRASIITVSSAVRMRLNIESLRGNEDAEDEGGTGQSRRASFFRPYDGRYCHGL